jgi:hypothetical protein
MAHGDTWDGKWRGNWRMEWVASTATLPRNMVYPALLLLMHIPRLPVVDWTEALADLNGLIRFAERRSLVSAHVPSHFKLSLPHPTYSLNLAPSDYTLFDIRRARRGERYPSKEALQETDHERDCGTSMDWFFEAIGKLSMMTATYRPGKGICWASSCLLFSLKIRKLLQMRRALIISECPSYKCSLTFIEGQAIHPVVGGNRCYMISHVWDQRVCGGGVCC